MRVARFVGAAVLILSLTACSSKKDDKGGTTEGAKSSTPSSGGSNADKIVGKWEISKPGKEGPPPGTTVEFTKDGKYTMSMKVGDKMESMSGTYKVEGDSIKTAMKPPGGKDEVKETIKIKSLTDTKLVTEDDKGSVDEFTKK